VAVWPDDVTRAQLADLDLGSAQHLRAVKPDQWHITLRFLGEVEDNLVPELVHAIQRAAGTLTGIPHCEVGPATAWFGGDRVLQLPVAGLDEVAEAVRVATATVVPETHRSTFTGHLTVARARHHRAPVEARDAVAGIACRASFDAEALDLIGSQLTEAGPRYTMLARVPLHVRSG
jgi:RNA 2',3'-cyclic 3'-phosphodiesterase